MFIYLVHSSALFCAALQSHWPKVDVRKEYVEKKRKRFVAAIPWHWEAT